MHSTLRILQLEHTSLVALLRAASSILASSRERAQAPDFGVLRAMLFYIAEFPERHHHRKESELLFPRLRARTPLARGLLDRLEDEHARVDACSRELEHALTAFEMLGEPRRALFEGALARHVDFYLNHMVLEEREIFTLAERVLLARDWEELDEEMAAHVYALPDMTPQADFADLFARIRPHLPAPPVH